MPAAVILLSDGGSNNGPPLATAITAARQQRIPVSTIALGTPRGRIELADGPVQAPVDTAELTRFARETGGQTFDAATVQQLRAGYRTLQPGPPPPSNPTGLVGWFLAAALVLVVTAAGLSLLWFSGLP